MAVAFSIGTTSVGNRARLAVLGGITAVTGYVYAADPDQGGVYPLCPSRALGIDCPLCGGVRGTNALMHGRIGEALDHNILLPLVLVVMAMALAVWLAPLVGFAQRRITLPRWVVVGAIGVLLAFGAARNLPFASLDYLASTA